MYLQVFMHPMLNAPMKSRFLEWISKLGPVNDVESAALERILTEKKVDKNRYILQPGQIAQDIYFVFKGAFRSYFLKDGEEITDYFFFEHSFAADYASLFSGQPSLFYLEAIEETQTVMYKKQDLEELASVYPVFETFGRVHAEQAFLEIEERMRMLQHKSLSEKYEHMLAKFPELLLRVPQHQIASYLGVKPESLSRIKRKKSTTKSTS